MSWFIDSAGVRHELFGKGGGQSVADFAQTDLLGQIPLDPLVREWADKGTPVLQADGTCAASQAFVAVADRLIQRCEVAHDEEDVLPTIDRSGGTGGKKRLPVAK
jgi:ATP-binding protein involved in chromosome partitioning